MTVCIAEVCVTDSEMADSYICRQLQSYELNYHVEVYADPDSDMCNVVAWIEDDDGDNRNLVINILKRVHEKIPELTFERHCTVTGFYGAPEVHVGLVSTIYGRRNADIFMIHVGDAFMVVDQQLH